MKSTPYHYKECGLNNIYLVNGFNTIETSLGKAVSINNIDGLHKAIGLFLVCSVKDFSGEEIRFLRHEMLMSQKTLSHLLGVSEQEIRRWENGKIKMPKPSESLLRLLYREHAIDQSGKIASILKKIANLEESNNEMQFVFKNAKNEWHAAA